MRNFFIFGLIAFCLIMAFGYTPSEYYKQSECAKVNQSEITALGDAIISGEIPPDAIEKKREEYQTQRDFAATCSDLTAQWTVANLTWRGFMLGVIGLGLLGWTLIETRRAATAAADTLEEAKKATEAAWESVKATKLGVRAEFQPYLEISHMGVNLLEYHEASKYTDKPLGYDFGEGPQFFVERDGNLGFDVSFWVSNKGKSPAYDIFCYGEISIRVGEPSDGMVAKQINYKDIIITKRVVEQLEQDRKIQITLKLSFPAENPSDKPALRRADMSLLDVNIRVSFQDYMTEGKRRTYFVEFLGNPKAGAIEKNRLTECRPNEKDNPKNEGLDSLFYVQSTRASHEPDAS